MFGRDTRDPDPHLLRLAALERLLHDASEALVEAFEAKLNLQRGLRQIDDQIDYRKAKLVTDGTCEGSSEDKRKHWLKRAEAEDPRLAPLVEQRALDSERLDDAEVQLKQAELQVSQYKLELRGLHATLAYLGGPA